MLGEQFIQKILCLGQLGRCLHIVEGSEIFVLAYLSATAVFFFCRSFLIRIKVRTDVSFNFFNSLIDLDCWLISESSLTIVSSSSAILCMASLYRENATVTLFDDSTEWSIAYLDALAN